MYIDEKNEIINKCKNAFNNGYGYACSESILIGFKDYFELDSEFIPRVVTSFGGGIAGNGYICGALQSSFMLLSIKYGRNNATEDRAVLYEKINNIISKFKEKYQTINCGDIRKIPKFIEENPKKLKKIKNAYHETICNILVEDIAIWLIEEIQ